MSDNDEDVYEVECIKNHRGRLPDAGEDADNWPKTTKVLVKWKGYDKPSDNTWEPLPALGNARVVVDNYIALVSQKAPTIATLKKTMREPSMNGKNKEKFGAKTDYVVAVPSYKRADIIGDKTLLTLKEGGVPAKLVTIFVANEEEKKLYESKVPSSMYGRIVVGELGIAAQRQFIVKHFKVGQQVVSLDDDLTGLEHRITHKTKEDVDDLDHFFRSAFDKLHKEELYIWGIYPCDNAGFMYPEARTGLQFIIGTCYGYITRHDKDLKLSLQCTEKEDVELTIKYFKKDGGVLRFNNMCVKHKKHQPGGLGELKKGGRIGANKRAAEYLTKAYPAFIAAKFKRPTNGNWEVRLKRLKKGDVPVSESDSEGEESEQEDEGTLNSHSKAKRAKLKR